MVFNALINSSMACNFKSYTFLCQEIIIPLAAISAVIIIYAMPSDKYDTNVSTQMDNAMIDLFRN